MKKILSSFIILLLAFQSYSQQKQINREMFKALIIQGGIIENYEILDTCDGKIFFNDIIYKDISIKNCAFHGFGLIGLRLHGNLFIDNCKIIDDKYGNNNLGFLFCHIKGSLTIDQTCNENNECKIRYDSPSYAKSSLGSLIIKNSNKKSKNDIYCSLIFSNTQINNFFIEPMVELKSLACYNTEFKMPVDLRSYPHTKLDHLIFRNCTFYDDLCLDNVDVLTNLTLLNNKYNEGLSIAGIRFDMLRSDLDWHNIIRSVDSVLPSRYEWNLEVNGLYSPGRLIRDHQSINTSLNQVSNSYRLIVNYLRNQNKRNEADSAYVLYREYETKVLYSNWKNDMLSLRNIIDLLFSYIIRWFSNYSTDFYYAIVHTFLIIIIFGLVYFIREIYQSQMELKHFILSSINKWKFFTLSFLSKKNIKNRRLRIKFQYSIRKLNRSAQINEMALDKYSVSYNFWLVLLKPLLRCQLISTNFFVTLGYVGVQAKGRMKYIAVIEGLIGWFFLILFTSCLVSNYIELN